MKSRRFSLAITFALSLSLVFACVLSTLMKTGTAALAQTDTASPYPMQNASFKGKVVMINYVQGSNQTNLALEQVQVHKLGDRYFLVGKGAEEFNSNLVKGHMTWVPVNNVTALAEMDSMEEMLRAAGKASQKGAPVIASPQKP